MVRFRTLGCYPFSGAMESNAKTVPEIIEEMLRSLDAHLAAAPPPGYDARLVFGTSRPRNAIRRPLSEK